MDLQNLTSCSPSPDPDLDLLKSKSKNKQIISDPNGSNPDQAESCWRCGNSLWRSETEYPHFLAHTSTIDLYVSEMRYCEISKEMSLLYFGLDVFCQFEARVPEFDQRSVCSVYCTEGGGVGGVAYQILGLQPQMDRLQLAQNTMTTSLFWSYNTSSLVCLIYCWGVD